MFLSVVAAVAVVAAFLVRVPRWDGDTVRVLLIVCITGGIVECLRLNYPDRKQVSVVHVFVFVAASFDGGATVIGAGLAGFIVGLFLARDIEEAVFEGCRLVIATAAGLALCDALFGAPKLEASAAGLATSALFAAAYTLVSLVMSSAARSIRGSAGGPCEVDVLTNSLLIPLPLLMALLLAKLGPPGLLLGGSTLVALQAVGRAYINLGTVHDELVETCSTLEHERKRLAEALAANQDLTQLVAHDLRSPLTTVTGYAELLQREIGRQAGPSPKQAAHVQQILSGARRLLNLTDQLIELQQQEDPNYLFDSSVVDPLQILTAVVDELQGAAAAENIDLELQVNGPIPVTLTSGWILHEIGNNLVSNAVKYTSHGGHVRVLLQVRDASIELRVEDDGIGLSAKDQERLFTKFFRSDSARLRGIPGTGLGLALTRRMVQRLGAEITVESSVGEGSKFTVSLPILAPKASFAEGIG